MDYTRMTDEELISVYQQLPHDQELSKELIKRGYIPSLKPYRYVDGSRGYRPHVEKNGKVVLG